MPVQSAAGSNPTIRPTNLWNTLAGTSISPPIMSALSNVTIAPMANKTPPSGEGDDPPVTGAGGVSFINYYFLNLLSIGQIVLLFDVLFQEFAVFVGQLRLFQ